MHLNPDCMRAVLLEVESADFRNAIDLNYFYNQLEDEYSHEDILYSLIKLEEAGFIKGRVKSYDNWKNTVVSISDITYEGHQFLSNIRSNTIWEKVKEKLTDKSIDSVLALSKTILSIIVTHQFS